MKAIEAFQVLKLKTVINQNIPDMHNIALKHTKDNTIYNKQNKNKYILLLKEIMNTFINFHKKRLILLEQVALFQSVQYAITLLQ